MKVKTLYKIILCFALCFSLTSCEWGLKIIGFELVTYPDKLFYVIGIDQEIDVGGGTVLLITHDNKNNLKLRNEQIQSMDSHGFKIKHTIDFNKEGIYIVYIEWSSDYAVTFPIQIVSLEEIRRIAESAIEQ